MAITKGAKKANRQAKTKKVYNDRRSAVLKETVKTVRLSVSKKDKVTANKELSIAFKAIDKAAKRGIIKKGTANRKKSRLAKAIAKLG